MNTLLTNIETIITNLISWLSTIATALIGNEVFQIMLAVVLFKLIFNLIKSIIQEIKARNLGVSMTGNTSELEYYRSLSDEEKEKYDKEHI